MPSWCASDPPDAGYLALSAFFRFSGCLCSSYEVAARFSASIIILMTLYSGYIVPVFAQKRWLFWIWYMNPFNCPSPPSIF